MKLLIVIPCLNEEEHLPALLDALCTDPATADARIVVADGGSTDSSAALVRARAAIDPRVTLLTNPKRLQSAGINHAVAEYGADSDILIRVDAHAAYPTNYVSRLIAAFRESGADSVTVAMRAAAKQGACFQIATACAQNSVLGAGGSPHRKAGARQWVDHGHHALFRMDGFRDAGGYDEMFSHNEDAEFDHRLCKRDGKILLAADIAIDYFPRSTAAALARQYFAYGRGRARTMLKHAAPLKLRQLIPVMIAPVAALALLTPLTPIAAAPALAWLGLSLAFGLMLGLRARNLCACASGAAAAIMHLSWSLGFLDHLARRVSSRRRPALAAFPERFPQDQPIGRERP